MQRNDRSHANQDGEEKSMKWQSKSSSRRRTQSIESSHLFLFRWPTLCKINAHLDPITKSLISFASFLADQNPPRHRSAHAIKWLDVGALQDLMMLLWIEADNQIIFQHAAYHVSVNHKARPAEHFLFHQAARALEFFSNSFS